LRFNLTLVDEQLRLKTDDATVRTRILLPRALPGAVDVLRQRSCDIGAQIDLRELFSDLPVALLISN
jgi:hypothetical protein